MAKLSKPRSLPPGFLFTSSTCSLELETHFWNQGLLQVIGIDEAGRGPLAGPVVAGAAILPADFTHKKLTDSKKLSHSQRESIYAELQATPGVRLAFATASVEEIDKINILQATHLAMRRATELLCGAEPPQMALIDGLRVPSYPWPQTPVVKGDALCLSIAAASIVAKVERDRLMDAAAALYPAYGFHAHKGYGTAAHLNALKQHGPCPIHRLTFQPIAQLTLELGI